MLISESSNRTLNRQLWVVKGGLINFRNSVVAWIQLAKLRSDEFLFPSQIHDSRYLSTRQYARVVNDWVEEIGLDSTCYGTHTMR